MRMKPNLLLLIVTLSWIPSLSFSNELLKEQVVRIINQINAIQPIIKEAQRYQSGNEPIKLHFTAFQGADLKNHNGVYEDLELIKKGLIAYLNQPVIAPKKVEAISGDFLDSPKKVQA